MIIPTVILKVAFAITACGFGLLLGAALGGTIFGDHNSHGFAGIINMMAGAGIGAVLGVFMAVLLMIKYRLARFGLGLGIAISFCGAIMTFALVRILDYFEMW